MRPFRLGTQQARLASAHEENPSENGTTLSASNKRPAQEITSASKRPRVDQLVRASPETPETTFGSPAVSQESVNSIRTGTEGGTEVDNPTNHQVHSLTLGSALPLSLFSTLIIIIRNFANFVNFMNFAHFVLRVLRTLRTLHSPLETSILRASHVLR